MLKDFLDEMFSCERHNRKSIHSIIRTLRVCILMVEGMTLIFLLLIRAMLANHGRL